MRRNWLIGGSITFLAALLVWAWMDGGEEPMHEISQDVQLPELTT